MSIFFFFFPAAKIGDGILLDHATGVVIGETAVVGNRVSLMHVSSLSCLIASKMLYLCPMAHSYCCLTCQLNQPFTGSIFSGCNFGGHWERSW